nr:TonB family protein [Fulvivirga sedimenti]
MENPRVVILEKVETNNSKVGRIAGEPLPIETQNGRTVRGRVILQDGTPIPGVNVAINGTNDGTVSDIDGYYQINVPNDASLVFSLIGMEQQEVTRPDREEINVTMAQDVTALSEVVVTGRSQPGLTIGANPEDGQAAFEEYLDKNLQYPEDGREGTVIVRIDISPNGNIEDMKVIRSMGETYDREAIRLLENGPKWTPALKNGNPVSDRVRVKIIFKKKD